MAENNAPVPASSPAPVTNQDAKNEALLGNPKESVATKNVAPVEDAPITPIAKKKIKWGDTEKEVSFDEAVQLAQKAWGIEEKAKVASKQANDAQALLDMLQKSPKEFAKRARAAGLDPNKLATEILYEQIELNSLSPEQRELRELKEKQAEADELKRQTEEAAKQADIDQKTKEWAIKFETDLKTALEAKKLPMSRLTLALTAQYIDAGLAEKKEYSVEQVLPYVLRDLKNIHLQTIGSLEGDALLDYLGEEVTNKIAAARVARYKKGTSNVTSTPEKKASKPLPDALKGLKGRAYFRALSKIKTEQGIGAFPGQE
jgi:hypothetical protein